MAQLSDAEIADYRDVVAKQKIVETLTRYCRGIDRCDLATLRSAFWPEATTDYGSGAQNAMDWAEATVAALKAMERTMHSIGNILIDVAEDSARVETYCTAYHELPTADGPLEMVVGGRYLDRFARREAGWRILERIYVMDWNRNVPSTSQWDDGIYAGLKTRGARYPDDPLNRLWTET